MNVEELKSLIQHINGGLESPINLSTADYETLANAVTRHEAVQQQDSEMRLRHLKRELEGAISAHHEDIRTINTFLNKKNRVHDWCEEFEEIEELQLNVPLKIWEDFEVTATVNLIFPIKITRQFSGETRESACEALIEDIRDDLENYIDMGDIRESWQRSSYTIESITPS